MKFNFMVKMKDMISYYLKDMETEFTCKKVTAQEYYKKFGLNENSLAKTSCHYAYNGQYLEFILRKVFELDYTSNPNDNVLEQVDKELENAIETNCFSPYNGPIAKSSSELD